MDLDRKTFEKQSNNGDTSQKSFDFGEREGQFAVSPIIKETGNMWGIHLPNKVSLNTNL